VEAGTPALRPAYRLRAVIDTGGKRRAAAFDVPGDELVLVPNTIIGLYDDFGDDLGVWCAYPLLPLQWHHRHAPRSPPTVSPAPRKDPTAVPCLHISGAKPVSSRNRQRDIDPEPSGDSDGRSRLRPSEP
jgi:hypothetical protein